MRRWSDRTCEPRLAEPTVLDQRQLTGTTWAHPAVLETALVCRDATAMYCYQIPEG